MISRPPSSTNGPGSSHGGRPSHPHGGQQVLGYGHPGSLGDDLHPGDANIGLFGFNLIIGLANDTAGASATNPGGYNLGMWIFSILGFLGLTFAFLLRKSEMGVEGHGLEEGMKK